MRKILMLAAAVIASSAHGLEARQPERARHGMVASVEKHATDAGVAVLESGGNAVDAAVAVGLVLAVTHPAAGNLGGGGFMLIRTADGRTNFIDFRERAPQKASHNMYIGADGKTTDDSWMGYLAVGVPGTVRGLELAQQKYGKKKWADLVEPAVQLARNGFPVSYGLSQGLRSKGTSEFLSRFPESKRIFLRDGKYFEPGELLIQPELAQTLERIRNEGSKDFYEGETARLLAADMAAHGGLITLDDLKNYKVFERQPVTGTYKGYTIITRRRPVQAVSAFCKCWECSKARATKSTAPDRPPPCISWRKPCAAISPTAASTWAIRNSIRFPFPSCSIRNISRNAARSIDPARATPSSSVRPGKTLLAESDETTHLFRGRWRGQRRGGDLHAERRLRQRRDGGQNRRAAQQRDGRFRGQAGRAQHVRPDSGRGQRRSSRARRRSPP